MSPHEPLLVKNRMAIYHGAATTNGRTSQGESTPRQAVSGDVGGGVVFGAALGGLLLTLLVAWLVFF